MGNVFYYLLRNQKVLLYIESNNSLRQSNYYHIYKRLHSIYNINVDNQNKYKIIENLPIFGQCANAICVCTLSWCKQASSQPSYNSFSTISLSNSLIPKLLYHSGDIMVLQCMLAHGLFCLKCIKTHQGWYICLQIEMIISLC